jgi:hypothetical protein
MPLAASGLREPLVPATPLRGTDGRRASDFSRGVSWLASDAPNDRLRVDRARVLAGSRRALLWNVPMSGMITATHVADNHGSGSGCQAPECLCMRVGLGWVGPTALAGRSNRIGCGSLLGRSRHHLHHLVP